MMFVVVCHGKMGLGFLDARTFDTPWSLLWTE